MKNKLNRQLFVGELDPESVQQTGATNKNMGGILPEFGALTGHVHVGPQELQIS